MLPSIYSWVNLRPWPFERAVPPSTVAIKSASSAPRPTRNDYPWPLRWLTRQRTLRLTSHDGWRVVSTSAPGLQVVNWDSLRSTSLQSFLDINSAFHARAWVGERCSPSMVGPTIENICLHRSSLLASTERVRYYRKLCMMHPNMMGHN